MMVNNAGIDWMGPFHEEPDEVSRRTGQPLGAVTGKRSATQAAAPPRLSEEVRASTWGTRWHGFFASR